MLQQKFTTKITWKSCEKYSCCQVTWSSIMRANSSMQSVRLSQCNCGMRYVAHLERPRIIAMSFLKWIRNIHMYIRGVLSLPYQYFLIDYPTNLMSVLDKNTRGFLAIKKKFYANKVLGINKWLIKLHILLLISMNIYLNKILILNLTVTIYNCDIFIKNITTVSAKSAKKYLRGTLNIIATKI